MRVFIVEDSVALRERLARMVSNIKNVEVTGYADNAGDAINRIKQAHPDVIITDIRLNQSNGYDLLSKLDKSGDQHVIVITNYPYPQYRKKYTEAGADYFFDKSTELDQVMQTLQRLSNSLQGPRLGPSGATFQPA